MNNCFYMLILIFFILLFLLSNVNKETFINIRDSDIDTINNLSKQLLEKVMGNKDYNYLSEDLTDAVIKDDFELISIYITPKDKGKINEIFVMLTKELMLRLHKKQTL
jgi:hypothetical protein